MSPRYNKRYLEKLAKKVTSGTATAEETAFLNAYYDAFEKKQGIPNNPSLRDEIFASLNHHTDGAKVVPMYRKRYLRIAAAAAVVVGVALTILFFHEPAKTTNLAKLDIKPGRNRETLTLANGKQIVITKSSIGQLATQNGAVILADSNALVYNSTGSNDQPVQYNTLSTARGEASPVPLSLADGTRVWLDAESSITFPTSFGDHDRLVKVTGEAYFEVQHNSAHPFKIQVKDQTIEDIGTKFNINAYDDEPVIKTTLIEGAVKVSANKQSIKLQPGQAAINNQSNLKIVAADVDAALAWKNNYFALDNENLESILQQVSRWYNVDIDYQNTDVKTQVFSGTISRYNNASSILKKLELTGAVHFKIVNNKILVSH